MYIEQNLWGKKGLKEIIKESVKKTKTILRVLFLYTAGSFFSYNLSLFLLPLVKHKMHPYLLPGNDKI